ncbi:methyltransferase [Niveispirillum fermenti]|uniref:methyltransferase n=1 Tax=Niveispirillum fermenti TaxID=1233113 RepID=UPI003A846991
MTDVITQAYAHLDRQDADGAVAILLAMGGGAEAAGLLGDLLLEKGKLEEASQAFRGALAEEPDRLPCLRGLVAALAGLGRHGEAMEPCRLLLDARPDDAMGHRHMAHLMLAAGDRDAALAHAREARFLARHDLEILIDTAQVMLAADEGLSAVEMLDGALRRAHPADPALPRGRVILARLWTQLDEPGKAAAVLRAALQADPDDTGGAAAALAELAHGPAAATLSAAFVRALFDSYADRFEQELVGKLRYGGPGALRDLLLDHGIGPGAGLRLLDAGCGTGLAGAALRPVAAHLAGFDLSPRMVEKSRARQIYDALWVGDLVASMLARPAAHDLVVAADVLVYVGDLNPVMAAAAVTLADGGHFAFTCERTVEPGFILHEGRRFAHGEAHLRRAVADAGLELRHLAPFSARTQRGEPVPGWIALAVKP